MVLDVGDRRHYLVMAVGAACFWLCTGLGSQSQAQPLTAPAHAVTRVPTPLPTPRPSLDLEGHGSLRATGLCSTTNCPGIFIATLYGPPLGVADVTFNVSVIPVIPLISAVSPGGRFAFPRGTPCYPATGSGQMNGGRLTVTFNGTLCAVPNGTTYSLRGGVQIYTTNRCPISGGWIGMSGTLDAFGEVHTAGPTPVPANFSVIPSGANQAVVSIIGAASQLPAPCPSP